MNRIILVGLLGADAELKFTAGGMAIAKLRIATTERRSGQEKTSWHRVTGFGKMAEATHKYLTRGTRVAIEGRIEYREWEKDGVKHYDTDIIAENWELLGSPGRPGQQQREQPQQHARPPAHDEFGEVHPQTIDDDPIPF